MNLEEIQTRMLAKSPVTEAEKAAVIRNNPHALAAFMVGNNPGNVNFQLRNMGYSHLPFAPDRVALARQMDLLINDNKRDTLDELANNFEVLPDGLHPEFLNEITNQFSK